MSPTRQTKSGDSDEASTRARPRAGTGRLPLADRRSPARPRTTRKAAKPKTPPRTPWGDPDLQGLWSNATTTPLERPDRTLGQGGARRPGVRPAPTRDVANRRNTDQAPRAGDPGTYNEFWWERGNLLKQTALIIDPADGRVPPLTPEGQQRAARHADGRAQGRGQSDSWEDRNLHERCILYHGVPPLPTGYNNNYQIAQTPRLCRHPLRNARRDTDHSARRPAASPVARPPVDGRPPRPLGGQHPGRRIDQLQLRRRRPLRARRGHPPAGHRRDA